ncbi:Uncharacterised protein [Mycobacteroides abscessus subsp. abscessus]|nr:Uncharacterised protein [Mycobacteroides abscessus subsp. abscessus]
MGKKKKQKNNKKQFWGLPMADRKEIAKSWIETYDGENKVKAYSKMFGLNIKNSMKELRSIGVSLSNEEKEYARRVLEAKKQKSEKKREKRRMKELELVAHIESDETFAFIAGYTEGGAPYGLTHEEMDEYS